MPAPLIPLGIAAAQTVTGFINKGKSKKEARELEQSRPTYGINPLYQQDLDLAESEVGGLSDIAETAYTNLNNQQFASSLDAILKSGGSVNNIGDVYGANQEGRTRLALLNDQMRVGQIDRLMRARRAMADEQDKEWQLNEFAPWQNKARAVAEARKGADAQIWSGLQSGASTLMQWADQTNQDKQFSEYLKVLSGNNGTSTSTGGISPQIGSNYNMNTGNQLEYISPTLNPGATPAGGTNWNWYQGG